MPLSTNQYVLSVFKFFVSKSGGALIFFIRTPELRVFSFYLIGVFMHTLLRKPVGILINMERKVYYIIVYDATIEIWPIRNIECLIT